MMKTSSAWIDQVKWNHDGLVPVITQDVITGKILTQAWMNRDALLQTVKSGQAVYWSRSRLKLWHKGEESGHVQEVSEVRMDCDNDSLLLLVRQVGDIACHTGRFSCFYQKLNEGRWEQVEPVIKDPDLIYNKK